MPRYFIDTHENGVLLHDDEGADLRGPDEARRIALESLADMAQARILCGDGSHVRIDIRDTDHRVIYRTALTLATGWIDPGADRMDAEGAIVREFLLGIVQSCAARGEDAVSRLEQFRALQQAVTALAPDDADATDLSRHIVAGIDRMLLDLERPRVEARHAAPQPHGG